MRLSQIHNTRKQGLVTAVIELARKKGVSPYVGDGTNNWSAMHIGRQPLVPACAWNDRRRARYHATAESAISFREIAETIGATMGVAVQAPSAQPRRASISAGWRPSSAHDMSASRAR